MSDKAKLESYLERLEKALGQIPTTDRAEIILEIKSHVQDSKDRYPDESMGSILSGLGEPESVANKYLIDRGLKPRKASKSPIVKWLTIGFLGTFAILALSLWIVVWNFTPIISIDEDEGKISILGGMISINDHSKENENDWQLSTQTEAIQERGDFSTSQEHQRVKIIFANTKANIIWKSQDHIDWDCKIFAKNSEIASSVGKDIILSLSNASKCQIVIPSHLALYMTVTNGQISLVKPRSNYEVDLTNGMVSISPDPKEKFFYDLKTTHGVIDTFDSADASPTAKSAKISVVNGSIKRD